MKQKILVLSITCCGKNDNKEKYEIRSYTLNKLGEL